VWGWYNRDRDSFFFLPFPRILIFLVGLRLFLLHLDMLGAVLCCIWFYILKELRVLDL
jgi:hypothetical protein